jgi:Flp pilus assembly pilin Flp
MKKFIETFLKEEAGQDLVEYALLLSLLAVVGIAGASTIGTTVAGTWTKAGNAFTNSGS